MRIRDRVALAFLTVAVAAGGYAAVIAWSGGFDARVLGIPIRSHAWLRPAALSLVAAVAFVALARVRIAAAFGEGWGLIDNRRVALALAAVAVASVAATSVLFSTAAVGGADSYGYVSQARLLADGRLIDRIPLPPEYRWPRVHESFTPLGYRPAGPQGAIAPTYPPGLPLLMAPLTWLPDPAVYVVVPCFGAVGVLLTYALGRRFGDPLAGAMAATLLAASPTFLFQVFQPMSDVPAMTCWMLALVLASRGGTAMAALAGGAAGVAILIRPNLAPLAALVGALAAAHGATWRGRLRAALAFTALLVPGMVALGVIQQVRYGSPLSSGYATFDVLFAWEHIAPNLDRYPRWLTELHTWFIWTWVGTPLWIVRQPRDVRRLAWVLYAFIIAVFAAYLPYLYFQPHEWTYARFLLPAVPFMLLFGSIAALAAARRLPVPARGPVVAAFFGGLVLVFLWTADEHAVFSLRAREAKYPAAAAYVRERLPKEIVVIAAQHSGSIRYYAGRTILRWDVLPANWLDAAVAALRARGHMVFAVVDGDEYPTFYQRFDSAGQESIRRLRLVAIPGEVRVYVVE